MFKRRINMVFLAQSVPKEKQYALILVAGGNETFDCWNTLEDKVEDTNDPEQVWNAFYKSFEQLNSPWHYCDPYLVYFTQGMHPDPKKFQGIVEMTPTSVKEQLQLFLGMVTYMGNFIPNISHHTEPLRIMLKRDGMFHWYEEVNQSFQDIKAIIFKANDTLLQYYGRKVPVTVQAGASQSCLGACFIQDNQLIAFMSKYLKYAEKWYANRERTDNNHVCFPNV